MHQVDCYTSALCTGAWMPGWPHRLLAQSSRAPSMQAPMVTTMACLQIRHVMIHRGSMKTTKTRKHVCGAGALAPEPRRRHSPAPAAPLCTNPKKNHTRTCAEHGQVEALPRISFPANLRLLTEKDDPSGVAS